MEQFCSDFSANIGVDEKNNSFGSSEQYSKRNGRLNLFLLLIDVLNRLNIIFFNKTKFYFL